MAQEWNMRYTLVDGQGNFGSVDGDSPAAMRYTECRLSKMGEHIMDDLDKDTVDMTNNFDDSLVEPTVMPTKVPNLLVNGGNGIAVGMATNIPTHNLGEVIDGCCAYIDNPDIDTDGLMEYIKAPDFPTGAYIYGIQGVKDAYETGRGRIIMRAKAEIETGDTHDKIVVNEIPYGVNKADLVKYIADLANEKKIEGISNVNDESGRQGMRIVVDVKRDANANVILNKLFKMTALQSSFSVNCIALVHGRPKLLTLKECVKHFVDHRHDVTIRRTKFDLKKAQDRAHILEGLRIAVDNLDAIIHTIRNSRDAAEAMPRLMDGFDLDEIQAKAILDMQFRRLTGLEREKIEMEYQDLLIKIADLQDILAHQDRVEQIIKDELTEVRNRFATPRKTEIIDGSADMEDEDLIPVENIIITLSSNGYIKRMTTDTYRVQNRGGKGIKGMDLNKDDAIDQFINMSTHDNLLIFTDTGRVFRIKGYHVPQFSRTSKGIPIINLIMMNKDEKVKALVSYSNEDTASFLFFVTKYGIVKRTEIAEFESINKNGKIAIKMNDDDSLAFVCATDGNAEIIIAGSNGKAVRFNETTVRPMSRIARGVKGFNTDGGEVIGLATNEQGKYILTISSKGFGKKSLLEDFRLTNRGNRGVKAITVTERTGDLVALRAVNGDEDLMIMSDGGIIIRISLKQVGVYSRAAQGVKFINLLEDHIVSSVAVVAPDGETEEEETTEETAENQSVPVEDNTHNS